jgi:hypothetical protein
MYSAQGIFQHHFQYKKVHTILDKIQYQQCGIYSILAFVQVPIFVHKQPKNATGVDTKICNRLVSKSDRNLPLHSMASCSQPLIFYFALI